MVSQWTELMYPKNSYIFHIPILIVYRRKKKKNLYVYCLVLMCLYRIIPPLVRLLEFWGACDFENSESLALDV